MANEYDAIANKLFKNQEEAPVEAGSYESVAQDMFEPSKQQFDQAAFVAQKKDPERSAEALKISNEMKLPADFVERNLDKFKEQKKKTALNYEELVAKSPRLTKWMQDPNNASIAQDDIEVLSQVERNTNRIRPYEDQPGYVSDLARAGKTGVDNLASSSIHLAAVYGLVDIDDAAQLIADRNKAVQDAQNKLPSYAREFQEVMAKEGEDVDKGVAQFTGSFQKFKDDKILEGLRDFGSGGIKTVAQAVDQIGAAAVRPRGAIRSLTESLAFSFPSLLTGAAGAKVGAAAGGAGGAAVGSIIPVAGTAAGGTIGAAAGGIVGFGAGTFAGSAATEVGAWVNSSLAERGYDLSNPDDIKRAYGNKNLMAEVRAEAERKGVTTAGVDALFAAFGGKFIKGAKGASLAKRAGAVAKDVGVQAAGEVASEFSGQVAAREGDLSKVSLGEALTEGIVSMGHSIGDTVVGASMRSRLSKKTTVAAEEIVKEVQSAQEAISEIQALDQLGEIATESKTQTRSPEVFASLIDQSSEGVEQAVFFQKDKWDQYWRDKGESPVKKAEELLGVESDNYAQAQETGQPIEIPLKDYVSKLGGQEEYKELLEIVQTKPDGMTVEEASEVMKSLPATMEELAQEAQGQQEILDQAEIEAKEIGESLKVQLKEAGRNPLEAVPIVEFYRTMGLKEGVSPKEIAEKYGLNVNRADGDIASDGETVFDQAIKVFHGTFDDFKKSDIKPSKSGNFGPGFYFSQDKADTQNYGDKVHEYILENSNLFDVTNDADISLLKSFTDKHGLDVNFERGKKYSSLFSELVTAARSAFPDEDLIGNMAVRKLQDLLKADGFDGIRFSQNNSDSNMVIFERKSFFQGKKGQIRIGNNKFNIDLFKTADKSTFFHESGHYFLEVMKDMASSDSSSQELTDDFNEVLKWLGVESADQIQTEHHEKWARGFEAYLREGNAPNSKLRRAFNTFKVWLTSVYRNLRQLDVELSDDIRGVMDRMFATQEEIAQAKQEQIDVPLFEDPIAAGMTESQANKYREAIGEAELYAKEQMDKKLIDHEERKKKKAYVAARKRIKESVTAEVNQIPFYNNVAILKTGKLSDGSSLPTGTPAIKLNKADFNSKFKDQVGNPKFKGMFAEKDGMSSEVAASILGFENAADMVSQISSMPSKQETIKALTEQRLEQEFPDLMKDEAISEEAEKLIHNEDRSKRLRLEYEFLASNNKGLAKEITRRVVKRPAPQKQIKELAVKTIANMTVAKIKPNAYRLAERRYAKEAGAALSNGDIETAFEAKQKELLNHELYRASIEAKDKIKKAEKDVKKFFEKDEKLAKTRDLDLVSAARAILARYGLGKSNKEPIQYIQKIKEYNPDAYETVASIVTGIVENPDDYKNISYGQLQDLMSSVNTLWALAKENKQITVDGQKYDLAKATDELVVEMQKFKKDKPKEKYNRTATDWEKMKTQLLGVKALVRRFEHWIDVMDLGDVTGPFRKFLFSATSDATSEFLATNKEYKEKITKLSEKVRKGMDLGEKIQSDEIGFEFKNKAELLGALLHTGNPGNLKKLLVGRDWGQLDEDGNLVSKNWDDFIKRMQDEGVLTKVDYDYVQSLWDLMEEVKPKAQAAHRKIFGFYFDEITAQEIETPFGTYRGGYAPAKVDPTAVTDITRRAELEEFIKGHNSYTYPASGGRGFTKGRVENFNKPLNIDIGLVAKHVEDVLRFSIIKPAVVDAAKVIMNEDFKSAMGELDPTVIDKMIKPALNRADKNTIQNDDPAGSALMRRFGSALKGSSSMQLMFANVVNVAEQVGGFGISATRISPKNLMRAGFRYMSNPRQLAQDIAEKSPAMKVRFDDQVFEMDKRAHNIFKEETNFQKMKNWAVQHTYFMQSFTQNIVDNITWSASYDESIAKGLTDAQAIRKADADVRITQSSRRPIDISNLETNTTLGFFQMFMNFFNMMANVNTSNFTKLYYEDIGMKEKYAKGLYLYAMGFATVAIVSAGIRKAAAGGLDEDEDNEYLDDLYDVFIGSQIDLGLAMIPVAGPAINAGLNQANDKFYDDRVSASPAVSALTTIVGTGAKAASGKLFDDKNVKGDVRDGLTALGIVTGLPLRAASKPLSYAIDIKEGKARPTGPIDAVRGVVTGKPGTR